MESNTGSWVINIGNEKGRVLNLIVTTSESMHSLQVLVEGIISRFSKANVHPPVRLYPERECCATQEGASNYQWLFCVCENLLVGLDIFHFMRHLAIGVTNESHHCTLSLWL